MSRGLDWRRTQYVGKPTLSIADEKDYRGRDTAERWLERKAYWSKRTQQLKKRRRNGAA